MADRQFQAAPSLAEQVSEIAEEAKEEKAHRERARAEHAERVAGPWWSRRERLVLIAVMVALPILGILLVTHVQGRPLLALVTPAPAPAVARHRAEVALKFVVNEIEAFRADYSELPDSLTEVGAPAVGEWTYIQRSDGHYQVGLTMYGQVVSFDSRQAEVALGR
jgi:hypothetical protein